MNHWSALLVAGALSLVGCSRSEATQMVKDGELEPGQLTPRQIYTNDLNPSGAAREAAAPSAPR